MRVLQAAHYGAPQGRARLFLFAARRGYQLPIPPEPMYHFKSRYVGFPKDPNLATIGNWDCMSVESSECLPPAVTSLEAIDDLPLLGDEAGICMAYTPRNPECVSRYARYMRHNAAHMLHDHQRLLRTVGKRVDATRPFSTIIGQDDKWSHSIYYAENRSLTVLERRRGQSFPDKMVVAGSVVDQLKIVGNAVPFLLARAVAASVMVAATGNPSSAPPLPYLKKWVDKRGNEVSYPENQLATTLQNKKQKVTLELVESLVATTKNTISISLHVSRMKKWKMTVTMKIHQKLNKSK